MITSDSITVIKCTEYTQTSHILLVDESCLPLSWSFQQSVEDQELMELPEMVIIHTSCFNYVLQDNFFIF
jgi:hypothetical protein